MSKVTLCALGSLIIMANGCGVINNNYHIRLESGESNTPRTIVSPSSTVDDHRYDAQFQRLNDIIRDIKTAKPTACTPKSIRLPPLPGPPSGLTAKDRSKDEVIKALIGYIKQLEKFYESVKKTYGD